MLRRAPKVSEQVTWLAALLFFILPLLAQAHSGGLDAYGCHHDRKAGTYHCHRGPFVGRSFSSRAAMLREEQGRHGDHREPLTAPESTRPKSAELLTPVPKPRPTQEPKATTDSGQISGRVIALADGDTITVLDEARTQRKVRLAGIDAPERGQAFAQVSREHLADLIAGKFVTVSYYKCDRHGRLVGSVLLNGRDVGLAQIEAGMAWHFKRYAGEQSAAERQAYARAEERARSNGVGLWVDQNPVPPWEWRKDPARVPTAQEIAKRAFASTVLLLMEDNNGQLLSIGSGFFVRDGVIASNLHVVQGASRGYAKLVGRQGKSEIEGVIAFDLKHDLVVLKVSIGGPPELSLGSSESVEIGDTVYAVGNPRGLEGTFSQGIVSGIRGDKQLLQITAPISPGSSGGPVLNSRGEVIGVSVGVFEGGQNLNFAIASAYLKALLAETGPARPLAYLPPAKDRRSIPADFGQRSVEGVSAGLLAWASQLWERDGSYTLTLQNRLRQAVRNVYCLVIFYDQRGFPVDTDLIHFSDVIPAGLARRVSGKVDASVKRLTTPPSKDNPQLSSLAPTTRLEFRILDFEIVR